MLRCMLLICLLQVFGESAIAQSKTRDPMSWKDILNRAGPAPQTETRSESQTSEREHQRVPQFGPRTGEPGLTRPGSSEEAEELQPGILHSPSRSPPSVEKQQGKITQALKTAADSSL